MKKRKLSWDEEFRIMLLVLDKFLWLGFIIMGYGMFRLLEYADTIGFYFMFIGATILIIFIYLLVKNYEPSSKK